MQQMNLQKLTAVEYRSAKIGLFLLQADMD